MMHWNYRIVQDNNGGDDWYSLREVYYRKDNKPWAWTEEPMEPMGDTIDELRGDFEAMKEAFERPMLVVDGDNLREVGDD
jgi:hypothetical protein